VVRVTGRSGERQDAERANALRAVDEHTLDIRRRRRTRMKAGTVPVMELGPAIGVVEVDDDVSGLVQYDQVLSEIGNGVYSKLRIAEKHRARLRDSKARAGNGEIDIGQILCRLDVVDVAIAGDLRDERACDLGFRKLLADRRQGIAG
jgi:hypothetical protein